MNVELGTAKVNITPKVPVQLAGFAHRYGSFESVKKELFLRAFYFLSKSDNSENQAAVIITADLIWWGTDRIAEMENKLQERLGIPAGSTIFHATHNHSGPQTCKEFSTFLGICEDEYLAVLEDRLVEAVQLAKDNTERIQAERISTTCGIGINRRKAENGQIVMAPNPEGIVDPELIVIKFVNESHRLKAVLFHYACHPTTTGDNFVSSEFPGAASDKIEQTFHDNVVAGYLQGCCGDVRPNMMTESKFYRGDQGDVDRLGNLLAKHVMDCIGKNTWTKVSLSNLGITKSTLLLDFENLQTVEQLTWNSNIEKLKMKEWRRRVQTNLPRFAAGLPLEFRLLSLGGNLSFLAMNAEMVVEYGIYIKQAFNGRVIPLPYSNGMIGYVPTEKQLMEGGYESKEFIYYFALPAPFDRSIEKRIKEKMRRLIGKEITPLDR
ncbi:neutral/alkaline ceramidase-like enzyme [Cytobacillus oceanisediminis]|uniref:Neutral/alkaline ceramidase-like enzyme n=1 Tax=Cytobacillus oceanisediminis TaxID=665099 RepID=A0A2V3A3Z1_9BACI|nr:neutral/alkaline non-lysosomal ceramidase N-terminal domain-containing protein [Cytobacillus oceanisediminis]PWW28254.1 neutral/alkaline ceramidase-like enzyme [Cytobacillus oceanisediminis]